MQKMEIEKEVTEFVKTINRGPFKEYFPKEKTEEKKIDWNKDDVYVEALYQGYLDACRTFKWSEKVKKDYPNEEAKRRYIEGKFKSGIARKGVQEVERMFPGERNKYYLWSDTKNCKYGI